MTRTLAEARVALLENPRSVSDVELLSIYLFKPNASSPESAELLLEWSGSLVELLRRVRSTAPPAGDIGRRRLLLLKAAAEMARRYCHDPRSLGALSPITTYGLSSATLLKNLGNRLLQDPDAVTNSELLAIMASDRAWPRLVSEILRTTRDLQELFAILSRGIERSPFTWRPLLASYLAAGVEIVQRYDQRILKKPDVGPAFFTPAVLEFLETLLLMSLESGSEPETLVSNAQRSQLDGYFRWLSGGPALEAEPGDA